MSDVAIPDGWQQVRLGDVCTKVGSGSTPTGGKSVYVRAGYPLIRSQNVGYLQFLSDGLAYIADNDARKLRNVTVKPRDVLVNITGDSVARCCMAPDFGTDSFVNQHVCIIRTDNALLLNGFLVYLLNSSRFQDLLLTIASSGATRNALTKADLESLQIPCPPIHEQKAIAHILGSLDDKIDQLRKTNTVLEDMASALFKSWFVDFDPVKAKQENRPTGLPKDLDDLFPDSFEDSALGPIPKGWRVGCVGDVCNLTKSSVNPGNSPDEVFAHYSLPAYDEGQQPKLELGVSIKSNKYLVPSDAVLLSKLNPHIPRIWMPDVSTQHRPIASTEFLVLCPNPGYSRELVYTLVTSQMFCQVYGTLVSGTTGSHQRVSPASVLDVAIVLPLETIANEFFDAIKHNALRKHSNIHQIRTLTNLRHTLLPKLISGELRVPDAEQMVADLGL